MSNGAMLTVRPLKLATSILTASNAVVTAVCRGLITANMHTRPNARYAGTCTERTGLTCTKDYVPSASEGNQESGIGGFSNTEFMQSDKPKTRQAEATLIMTKRKRKLTTVEKAEKKHRQQEYTTIFINGKQKRVKRPPAIDGMDPDEFILRNADPIWLHQNEMWEYMTDDEKS